MSDSIGAISSAALPGAAGATVDRLHNVLKQQRASGNGAAVGQAVIAAVDNALAPSGKSVSINGAITDVNEVLRQTAQQLGGNAPQFAFPNNKATLSQDFGAASQGLATLAGRGTLVTDAKYAAHNAVNDLANKGINVTGSIANTIVDQAINSVETNQGGTTPASINLVG